MDTVDTAVGDGCWIGMVHGVERTEIEFVEFVFDALYDSVEESVAIPVIVIDGHEEPFHSL